MNRTNGYNQKAISGTSMASPHVAGLAAYLMTLLGWKAPEEMCSYIAETGTKGPLTGLPDGTANIVAFNGNPSS
jgi:subtilisin family serine protease